MTDGRKHAARVIAATAVAYALAGIAVMPSAIAPGYAAPLYPAAGVALASTLVFGLPAVVGVALGSLAVNVFAALLRGHIGALAVTLPAWIASGAALQALVGARLIQRLLPHPPTLTEPRDVIRFFVAGSASCLVNTAWSGFALVYTGVVPTPMWAFNSFNWWLGDVLGAVVVGPIVLSVIARPREAWEARRLSVGAPLAVAIVLLTFGVRQVARWDDERQRAAFEREAVNGAFILTARLNEPLLALEALHGVFIASEEVTRTEMRLASAAWLKSGALQALSWTERVKAEDIADFELRQRAEGIATFRVFDRTDIDAGHAPARGATGTADKMVLRYIEPPGGNEQAFGLNILSIPQNRSAIETAVASGLPSVTAAFLSTQASPKEGPTGIVIYHAIYQGPAGTEAERRRNLRGLVSSTIRMNNLITGLGDQMAGYLKLCIVDVDPAKAPQRIAGPDACEHLDRTLQYSRDLAYAGRHWQLRFTAEPADMPNERGGGAVLFSVVGVLAVTMLCGFLLVVTGRTRRIESAVRERTAALESEVRERGLAEVALRASEQRFRNILDNVPIGMVYADLQGRVIQTNPSLRELTGYTEAELLELPPSAYTHPDDVPQASALTAQLVAGDIPMYRRHQRYIAKNGAILWVRVTVSLLRDAQGGPLRIVAVVEDITEHLRLEEAEHAREVAESSNRAKSEFLSRMSHELRTPLNAMLGFAQLLELDRRHPLAEPQRPWVAQIQQAGWHLLEMINDVLDLSRIESGHLRLHTEALDLRDLLGASLSMVEGVARQRGITISHDLGDGAAAVMGDATRVTQILTNLLSNAVKYNVEAGRIHIASRAADAERVELTVIDTGLGMTPEQLAQLFQPFNRLGRERSTQQEGTGIGLVIAQRLAELMGGSLEARSVAGEGSSFILVLPRVVDADTVRSDLDSLETMPAEYHRRIVHYVEDNETNVEVMRGILAQRPQVQMEVSVTGLDSLAAMRASRPDLILLDMHLPDISGLELLRHLKADARMATIPVVVVSADALAQQIEAAFDAGASHYLTKPVSVSELLAVVDALLEQMDTRFG